MCALKNSVGLKTLLYIVMDKAAMWLCIRVSEFFIVDLVVFMFFREKRIEKHTYLTAGYTHIHKCSVVLVC